MSKRTLIGLMFCTLFLSAPAFAQPNTAQPVIQTAQAVQNDVTIPEGTTQEFDTAKGEIVFDGVLTNKGTIIIRSSDPAQAEAILRAAKVVNEGKIVSEVPTLTINTQILGGTGDYKASETINVVGTDRLEIRGGRFYSEWFRPKTRGWLIINANRIDGKVELEAEHLSMGVREGNLNVVKQKLDGDPLIYNTGGDITTPIAPSGGHDLLIVASGSVILSSGIDATGSATNTEGKIAIGTGYHFVRSSNGEFVFPCGSSGGVANDCSNLFNSLSQPGGPLETQPGDFPLSGKIVISGDVKAKSIIMTSREIEINGNLRAVKDGDPAQATVSLFASKSITVTGTIKTDKNQADPNYGSVSLIAPTINVSSKITSDQVTFQASANNEAAAGSITTGAIEAGTYIAFNAGSIVYNSGGGGGGAIAAALPFASFDPGDFTIKTGKLTAGRYVLLGATGNIDTGAIELLENMEAVPVGAQDVRIHANVGKANAPEMKVGGGTNGPASITVHGTTDLSLDKNRGVIYLSNGPSGDITIDGSKIQAFANSHGVQSLIANAGTGKITLKGGLIAVDGNASVAAGSILLIADEVKSNGATLSASDTMPTAEETPPQIIIATSNLTMSGDLTAQTMGNMLTAMHLVPKGSYVDDPLSHFEGESIRINPSNIAPTENQVLVAGVGNLTIKAKSNGAKVEISAKPLKFNNGGTTNIAAEGIGSKINIEYPDAPTGENSLVFGGGAVTIDASNPNDGAGTISIKADKVKNDTTVTLKANATANGDGGRIEVLLDRGSISLGASNNGFKMSATSNSGKGGTVNISNHQHNGTVVLQNSFDSSTVNVSSTNGDGGTIDIWADHLTNNAANAAGSFIANGAKDAGRIDLKIRDAIVVSSDSPGVQLTAISTQSGNGGKVHITSTNSSVTIEGVNVNVQAAGNGRGGVIDIKAKTDLTVNGDLSAKGAGNRKGGQISLDGDTVNLQVIGLDVSGGSTDGDGGEITINSVSIPRIGSEASQAQLKATGFGTGSGGTITVNSPEDLDLLYLAISARGGTNGEGGRVILPKSINGSGLVPRNLHIESGKVGDVAIFDGSIKIGSITCQSHQTIYAWPKRWLDCVNPANPTFTEGLVPDGAFLVHIGNSSFSTLLEQNSTLVMAMKDANDWRDFFGFPAVNTTGLAGISGNRADPPFHASAWLANVSEAGGGSHPNAGPVFHIIIHELAHDLDFIYATGGLAASDTNAWLTAYTADTVGANSDLNTMLTDPNDPNSPRVPRPCMSVYSNAICANHPGMSNWEIYQTIQPNLSDKVELFCEMFANRFDPQVNPDLAIPQSLMTNMDAYVQQMITAGHP